MHLFLNSICSYFYNTLQKNLDLALNIYRLKLCLIYIMSGWPSGLRRQTQGIYPFSTILRFLVLEWGRGFESHFWQKHFLDFSKNKIQITYSMRNYKTKYNYSCVSKWIIILFLNVIFEKQAHTIFFFKSKFSHTASEFSWM